MLDCVASYHPDHEVGEEGDPQSGGQEGEQVPALPSRLAAVGNCAVKQEAQGPGEQPLQSGTPPIWGHRGSQIQGTIKDSSYCRNYSHSGGVGVFYSLTGKQERHGFHEKCPADRW